jgi:hypothetical protein
MVGPINPTVNGGPPGVLVQLQLLDNTLVVLFRHMWIREINLKNGRSHTLIDKNKNPYV